MAEMSVKQDSPSKKVGVLLFLGILFFPIVFVWFVVRKGHSTAARVLGFAWLAATVFLVAHDDPDTLPRADATTSAQTINPAPAPLVSPTGPSSINIVPTTATPASAPPAKNVLPIATDTATVAEIEKRFQENEKSLRKFYGTSQQLSQSQKDLIQLAMIKVDYLDNGKRAEEAALGKRAAALGRNVEMQSRLIYASTLEESFMKSGLDVKVSATGANREQIRVVYALMSQPLVYKFQNEIKLAEKAASFGFRKLIYSNGFESDLGKTWTINLKD